MRRRIPHGLAAVAVAAAVLLALLPPAGMPPAAAQGGALALATIALLATGTLPEYVCALLFFVVAVLFAVAPNEVVFSGFTSTAFWLVFGGLVIGAGIRRTGLAERIARTIATRLGGSYAQVIVGMGALGLALSFLMPSTLSRILLMLPIVLAMADRLGFAPGRPGRAGMVLCMSFATMIPAFTIFPATVPAMVLAGASETLYGHTPTYGTWLLLHFPILGLLKTAAIVGLTLWLFPDRVTAPVGAVGGARPAGRQERLMAVLLVLALGLWVTDFLHGISPAWVALGVATVCVLPVFGIVRSEDFGERVNLAPLLYVAGVLGIGAVIAHTGAGDWLAVQALALLDLHESGELRTFSIITGLSAVLAMLTTQPGLPAVMTPLAGTIAGAADLPVASVLMMQVVGYSTVVLPYQTPPLIVAMQLGQVPMAAGNKLCLALLAITLAVLLPLDYVWWRLLGWIG